MSVLEFATGILLPISPGGQNTCLIPQINLLPFLFNLLCEPLFLGSQGVLDSCFTYIIASSQLGICVCVRARACAIAVAQELEASSCRGEEGGQEEEGREERKEARMDLSGTQGELPMPMHAAASPYVGLHHENHHHHHTGSNGRHMSPPTPPAAAVADESKNRQVLAVSASAYGGGGARYRECLKNHAAAIGGRATDGCGEFMPAGEDGSLDALRCSACGCHRNFHRKELDHPDGADPGARHHHLIGSPLGPLAAHRGLLVAAHAPTRMVMPLSAMHTSESDEAARPAPRKRSRTKFTAEQKARMLGFAEEVGWRLQKLEDAVVQRFCQEVGVKRRVLKVWMHNNKHTLARRHQPDQQPGGPGQSQSPSPSPPQLRLE